MDYKIKKPAPEEYILLYELVKVGLYPKLQFAFDKAHVDFAFPHVKLAIEVDGEYHYNPKQREKDMNRDEFIQSQNWTVQRYNSKLVQSDPEKYAYKIKRLIESREQNKPIPKTITQVKSTFSGFRKYIKK